jgi:hypothetical protein
MPFAVIFNENQVDVQATWDAALLANEGVITPADHRLIFDAILENGVTEQELAAAERIHNQLEKVDRTLANRTKAKRHSTWNLSVAEELLRKLAPHKNQTIRVTP